MSATCESVWRGPPVDQYLKGICLFDRLTYLDHGPPGWVLLKSQCMWVGCTIETIHMVGHTVDGMSTESHHKLMDPVWPEFGPLNMDGWFVIGCVIQESIYGFKTLKNEVLCAMHDDLTTIIKGSVHELRKARIVSTWRLHWVCPQSKSSKLVIVMLGGGPHDSLTFLSLAIICYSYIRA